MWQFVARFRLHNTGAPGLVSNPFSYRVDGYPFLFKCAGAATLLMLEIVWGGSTLCQPSLNVNSANFDRFVPWTTAETPPTRPHTRLALVRTIFSVGWQS